MRYTVYSMRLLTRKGGPRLRKALWLLAPLVALACGCVTMGNVNDAAVIRAKNKVAPALVHIRPVKEVFTSGKKEDVPVMGSGFIISPDGFVVTNEHVAGESKFVRCVLYNKEEVEAEVVGEDRYTDVAVLKLQGDCESMPYAELGSSSALEAGQAVLALGSPHGLARSVSLGIVSVTDRHLADRDTRVSPYNNWIQTDAAINPGNSGGPLVNLKGEVVGINARVLYGAENVGFAIPIDIAKEVIDQIILRGRVERSWLGEILQPMTAKTNDPTQQGVVIADVDPLSPGYEAGLRPGDVMLSVNGQAVNARFEEDLPAVRKLIADLPVGEAVSVRIARGDEEMDLAVTTVAKSELRGREVEFEAWGFTASEVTPAIARRVQLPSTNGVFVIGSQEGGIAANARLEKGDIILKVDDEEIEDLTQFQDLYRERVESRKRLVLLDVRRGALTRFVLVKQEAADEPEPEPIEPQGQEGPAHEE